MLALVYSANLMKMRKNRFLRLRLVFWCAEVRNRSSNRYTKNMIKYISILFVITIKHCISQIPDPAVLYPPLSLREVVKINCNADIFYQDLFRVKDNSYRAIKWLNTIDKMSHNWQYFHTTWNQWDRMTRKNMYLPLMVHYILIRSSQGAEYIKQVVKVRLGGQLWFMSHTMTPWIIIQILICKVLPFSRVM